MKEVWLRGVRKGAVVLGSFWVLSGCTASPSATDVAGVARGFHRSLAQI